MSVAGSTSSQGTHSRSPSRSRSPPYNDSRYRYSSRYDSYNYRPNRNGMSAALDDYRDLRDRERDRERDRDRDRPMGLMREDRFMSPRGGRDRDDRYTPYYRDDIPSSHHYSSSSSAMPRDYPKISTNSLRRDLSSDRDPNKLPSASGSVKDSKDDKPPNTPTESYTPTSRYMDWRDRDRERDRDRRYREDDRRRDYDRRRDGYMRDMRYESSSYGAPPPNYQIPPFGGDSYRPDRDMPPSPSMPPYYERDHDRDFYNRRSGGASSSNNSDYDRYRGSGSGRGGSRPSWSSKLPSNEDNSRRLDRDRPERINTDNLVRSERTSPTSAYSTTSKERELKSDDKIEQDEVTTSPSLNDKSVVNSPEQFTTTAITKPEVLETGEVVEEESKESEKEAVPEQPEPSSPKSSPQQPEKMEIVEEESPEKLNVKKEEQELVTTNEIVKDEQVSLDSTTTSVREQGEVVEEEEKAPVEKIMTQEEIVNRISDIENQISMNEELLEAAIKREEEEAAAAAAAAAEVATAQREDEDVEMADDEDETAEDEAAQNKEEAKKQALHAMETEPSADMMDFTEDASSPIIRKRPQLLINQLRSKIDEEDDRLYEKILLDNKQVAKENSAIKGWQGKEEDDSWSDEENWSKPLYAKIEDYPCYKENVAKFAQLRIGIARTLTTQKLTLEKKERLLKKEYKSLYEQWKEKNIALDRIRDIERRGPDRLSSHRMTSRRIQEQNQPEEYTDGVIFTSSAIDALRFNSGGASTPYNSNGLYTSDAARSEAELLEIIQSLESAEMRNPESRAKKTTANIPPMILDERERMRTFDDRSGLVENPLTYYHTGPDTGDVWNQEEVTTFMESYMMYPKQFERISIAIGTKTACQCVLFYYRKKKKIDFKALMKKGRRGKATKHRDRIAAAIRLATGDSSSGGGRKTKSKGSALMADIGEAQNSRKAKEKDAERKSRELRDLEQANVYWDGVAERKKAKRPANNTVSVPPISTPIIQSGPPSSASDDTDMMLTNVVPPTPTHEKRRTQSGSSIRRTNTKGRSPREAPSEPQLVLPGDAANATVKRYSEEQQQQQQQQQQLQQQQQQQQQQATETTGDEDDDKTVATNSSGSGGGVAKWSEREKELAVEAFKEHGRDFVQVSGLVKSKTEEQCRNFYHNFKRKFGPNAFNEEDSRGSSTVSEDLKPIVSTDVHQELAAISGRTDLKAEEEDAAAALVGMFQMGSNTTPREESNKSFSRSRTPSGHDDIVLPPSSAAITSSTILPTSSSSMPIQPQHQPTLQPQPPQPSPQQQQQRRRRIRSTSTKSETAADDATEWTDPDFVAKGGNSGSSTPGRKIGRQTTLTDAKRPAYSSYWSVSERNEFQRLLGLYGRDWDRLSKEMKSKTVIQVRNFYANNEEKMQLKGVVDRYQQQSRQPQPQPQPLPPPQQQPPQPPPPSYDTSAAHFQALQNFPFPQPIADQQPLPQTNKKAAPIQPYTAPPNDRGGYYTNDNYPPTSSTYHKPSASKNQSIASIIEPGPSAVTKVADLLNNDDPAEPNQNSWETWFGS